MKWEAKPYFITFYDWITPATNLRLVWVWNARSLRSLDSKSCTVELHSLSKVKAIFCQEKMSKQCHRKLVILAGPENGAAGGHLKDYDVVPLRKSSTSDSSSSSTYLDFQKWFHPTSSWWNMIQHAHQTLKKILTGIRGKNLIVLTYNDVKILNVTIKIGRFE